MYRCCKNALRLLLLASAVSSATFAQGLKDLINVIPLRSGEADTLLASDVFYAKNYDIKFTPNTDIDVNYDNSTKNIVLKPRTGTEGLVLVEFSHDGKKYQLPVNVNVLQTQKFTYKASGDEKGIYLFGSFNGWNRNNLPMSDNDGDKVYETEIQVEPGRYEYKYFIDGQEIVDPANPDKVSNGMGSFNNIVTVPQRFTKKAYLHVMSFDSKGGKLNFRFLYEKEGQSEKLQPSQLTALLNNEKIDASALTINDNYVTVSLDKKFFSGDDVIRVAVKQGGQTTNVQTVMLQDGKPLGTTAAQKNSSWHDAVIYSVMIDRFANGDKKNDNPLKHPELSDKANYNGGDLKGLLDKINEGYFDRLGVNTLWLSPVYDNTNTVYQEYPAPHRYFTGYHGYWPTDNYNVEEHFGSLDLLKKVVETAHKHNIKILLDFVANHVHVEHPLYKEHPDWFGSFILPDGRKNLRLWDEYRLTTWFETYLPKFDYQNSEAALKYTTDNAVWWLKEIKVDGFRQDAVKHIPYVLWRTLTRKVKEEVEIPMNKKVYQVGETFGSYDLISSYVNSGQLSAQFNFNLYDTAIPVFSDSTASFSGLDNQMKQTFSVYGVNHLMANLMDSHDKVRFIAYADGDIVGDPGELAWNNPPKVDDPMSYKKTELYLAYMATIPGLPTVYYGDEIGLTGASDPDNRRMMKFGSQLDSNEKSMLENTGKIFNLRKNNSALRYGDFQTLNADKYTYAYLRSDVNQRVLVVLNKASRPMDVTVKLPSAYRIKNAKELPAGKTFSVENDGLKVSLPAYGWQVLSLQ